MSPQPDYSLHGKKKYVLLGNIWGRRMPQAKRKAVLLAAAVIAHIADPPGEEED